MLPIAKLPRSSAATDVDVVIVSWNTRNLLSECLKSLSGVTSDTRFRPFVVDNASSDGSAQMVRLAFPHVCLVANADNVGFARANNQAIAIAMSRYVLLLNPDTRVRPDALQTLIRFMDDHPKAAAAAPRLLNADGSLHASCQPAPTLFRELWRLFHLDAVWPRASYRMRDWPIDTPRLVDVVQGACIILRRSVLDAAGGLDEGYFIYSEEVDLCHRLRRRGWEIWWAPQAEVVHYGGQSTRQVAAQMFVRLYEAKVRYFRKNHGPTAARAYKAILLLAAFARLMLSPGVWLLNPDQRARQMTLARRYRNLVRVLPRL